MSEAWQPYIDNLLSSGNINEVAIVGIQDRQCWARSPNFNVSEDEIKHIMAGFQQKNTVQASGVRVNGQKFFYLLSDDMQMQGKQGNCGCSIARGNTCVIIGTYGEGQQPGAARNTVENMALYLKGVGY